MTTSNLLLPILLIKSPSNVDEDIQTLAESIEAAIYRHHNNQVDEGYKESIRSRVFNLKDSANPLCQNVLSGEIDPDTFASFSADDMARPEFRRNQERLRRKSIIDSMGYEELQPRHRDLDNLDEDRP
ncbi:transcription factor S-II, central domain-domain-containing protein [Syncephalastrum racemosum]|uniref:Transcription factor S-II, central domain-domain-containing protein n=1 Tax=Syncephalastrum racemosum TaxID=13706 RepID=A0A1X2HJE9_SYNRA|nr:transcription factor S-II, central domain-domain-containing protein [Syncephalastrum racemosum]